MNQHDLDQRREQRLAEARRQKIKDWNPAHYVMAAVAIVFVGRLCWMLI